MITRSSALILFSSAMAAFISCSSPPPPRTVFEDTLTLVQIRHDGRAGTGHSHPAHLSPEQVAEILRGIRITVRQDPVLGLLSGRPEPQPAFFTQDIEALAPQISSALADAGPHELVTYYRRVSDTGIGLGVTSGGLFVNDHYLYFVMANHRNRPADIMGQAVTYEIDPSDDPLLSLRAMSFALSFAPDEAVATREIRGRWQYIDPGKMLVLDLHRLSKHPAPLSRAPTR